MIQHDGYCVILDTVELSFGLMWQLEHEMKVQSKSLHRI